MNSRTQKLGYALLLLILGAGLAISPAFAAAKGKTFTGTVSDAMCGATHAMGGSAASCTRECVGKGSKYALVVGDKVYTLDTTDKAALAALDKQAGAQVKVTGTEQGDTITVTSVVAAP
jgi:hydroxyethylthiazole kinase-like sugar kinase family protein